MKLKNYLIWNYQEAFRYNPKGRVGFDVAYAGQKPWNEICEWMPPSVINYKIVKVANRGEAVKMAKALKKPKRPRAY